ncbi:MAG: hypothetical protein ACTHMW_06140 [Actinomycetes bacterium]
MSITSRPRSYTREAQGLPATEAFLVAVTGAAVLMSAAVHLEQYAQGFKDVAIVGPSFVAQGIVGIAFAVWLLAVRGLLPVLACLVFGAGSIAALVLSTTSVGFFGVHERWQGMPIWLSLGSESVAVLGALALLAQRRRGLAR